ncbi:MAG: septum formation protein Maf [Thermodesulfatator sp.]|nr:MAG: septum formation protein Maf [Thermodesulfatator sp.]
MYNKKCKGPFRTLVPLVLASGSPRRKELMERIGLDFHIKVSSSRELDTESGLEPHELVRENAILKARDIASVMPGHLVIGADTCVALSNRVFGKPRDTEDAVSMLEALAGRWHEVFTGLCIILPDHKKQITDVVKSRVYVMDFGPEVMRSYCESGEPMDKAGSYAVQGAGSFMIKEIHGSWTNVVGLPMTRIVEILLEAGAIEPCVKN